MKSLADNLKEMLNMDDDVPFPESQPSQPASTSVMVVPVNMPMNITPVVTAEIAVPISESPEKQVEDDLQTARNVTYQAINKANAALDHLINLSTTTESARGFEVVNQLLGTIKDTAAQLVELHVKAETVYEKRKKRNEESTGNVTNIQNNIMLTPVELLRKFKETIDIPK